MLLFISINLVCFGLVPAKAYQDTSLVKNISINCPYLITPMAEDKELMLSQNKYYPDTDGKELTDGILAPENSSFAHEAWQGWAKQDRHIVTIDLQKMSVIHEIAGRFFNFPEAGIYYPEKVRISTSLDGEKWSSPITTINNVNLNSSIGICHELGVKFKEPVKARFLQMEVFINDWCFIDELIVKGENLPDDSFAKTTELTAIVSAKKGLLGLEEFQGWPQPGTKESGYTNHIVLMYFGGLVPNSRHLNTIDFIPYVGYVDTNIEIKDTFFDTFLLLPASTRYYGITDGRDYDHVAKPSHKEDWELFINELFTPDYQLDALNRAVQIVNEKLTKNEIANVIIAIPYPSTRQSNFGKLNDNSKSLSFAGMKTGDENRFLAVSWFIEEILTRWEAANFPNLRLAGFYWYQEDIESRNSPQIFDPVISNTAKLIHEKELYFYWIPYYQARGFRNWQQLGFDVAMLQPNFSFCGLDITEAEYRLKQASELASRYGLGLEIELHMDLNNPDLRRKYLAYLEFGYKLVYQKNSVISYYQSIDDFAKAAFHLDPEIRLLYDETYKFVKGF